MGRSGCWNCAIPGWISSDGKCRIIAGYVAAFSGNLVAGPGIMGKRSSQRARIGTFFRGPLMGKKSHSFIPILLSLSILPENRIITRMVIPLSESRSPLARLVLFMVCLSIAGVFVSGVYTYTVELPQKSLTAPENAYDMYKMNDCLKECNEKYWSGTNEGVLARSYCYRACTAQYGS